MTQQNQETVTKQKNPLRIEQGRKLVEYNRRKKEELKRLNDQITKQYNIAEHKPKPYTNTYVYAGSLSVLGLAISGSLWYSKFKKPERKLIDIPAPPSTVRGSVIFYREGGLWKFFEICKFLVIPPTV